MLIPICISRRGFDVVLSLAFVFIRSRRAAKNPASDSARRRAVLEDCGDDVVWEIGKLRPIVATKEFEARMGKRAFLRRVAFSVSAFLVAWLASRGRSVAAFGTEPRPADGRLPAKPMPVPEDIHSDYSDHTDQHSDSWRGKVATADSHSRRPRQPHRHRRISLNIVMLIPISISVAALLVASLAAVFIRSRRRAAKNPASDSARRRAVLEDCGDDVVWEIGKLRPIVATREFEARMGALKARFS